MVLMLSASLDTARAQLISAAPTIHNPVIPHKVPHHTEGVMHGPLGLVDDHPGASPEEDGDGLAVLALLNDQHFILCSTESKFPDQPSGSKLLLGKLLEPGHN